jgi:hypothetical protein
MLSVRRVYRQLTPSCRKSPWRLSRFQKLRQRRRLRAVDNVVATVEAALLKTGVTVRALERWKEEMPTEAEMLPKDKYTMFDRKEKRYRKGIHSTFIALLEVVKMTPRERLLIRLLCRIAEMDASITKSQPSRILSLVSYLGCKVDLYYTIEPVFRGLGVG